MEHLLPPETPKIKDQSRSRDTTSEEAYLVPTDIEVERGYLPTGRQSTCSSRLYIVKYRVVTTTTSSGTKGTDTLSTSVIVEDAGEGSGHSG